MRLALYQTEIAQNLGTMLRLGACLGVSVDVIEPIGFPWDDKRMQRAGMDYIDLVNVTRHKSFDDFISAIDASRSSVKKSRFFVKKSDFSEKKSNFSTDTDVNDSNAKNMQEISRLILLDVKAEASYTNVEYKPTDIIMVGRESCGVPKDVYDACDMQVRIPMVQGARSLNVALSAAIGLSEALRQVLGGSGCLPQ
ncbi:MAG: tRNA methyltransferase [Holosporales bacterium]|jgi:tRNA (cytidine/uridine-2'-O-)-methyltransferase|nr:tRNA methyltransferase [Holosporales bacterium]